MSDSTTHTRDMVLTRVFDAPIERVWRAWTEPEQVMQWWGPEGFTAPVADMDVREGGTSLVCMRSPGFGDLYNTWTYHKIVPMERLEFIQRFADKDGKQINPADVDLPPEIPREVPHVVTFRALSDNRTQMTVTEYGYPSDQIVEMSRAGMAQVLDKMAASLSG